MLSLKSSAKTAPDPYNSAAQGVASSIRLRPRQQKGFEHEDSEAGPSTPNRSRRGEDEEEEGNKDVMWEVGSLSDDDSDHGKNDEDEDGEKGRKGVGGGKGYSGERRGLLVDDEEDEGSKQQEDRNPSEDKREEEEGFGGYESVPSKVKDEDDLK